MAYSTKRSYAKKPYKKTRRVYKKKANSTSRIASICKSVIMKKAEAKRRNIDMGKTELYHNSFHLEALNSNTQLPGEGTGDDDRIGNEIYSSGYLIRALIGQKFDRPNVTFKYYVIKVNRGFTYSYSLWFQALMNNVLLDTPHRQNVKVLKSGTIKPNVGASLAVAGVTREFTFPFKLWLPYKKHLKLARDGPVNYVANDGDIYFMIAPFDAYGTLITDNIAYIDITTTFYYKDV